MYSLPSKYDHIYEKLEDIKNSEPFSTNYIEFTFKDAKLFSNIFAYVQSHYLMRFGLAAAYHPVTNVIFCEFPKSRKLLNSHIAEHLLIFEKLTKPSNKSHFDKVRHVLPTNSDSVTGLKNISLNFSSKTMILANDCRTLDIQIQNVFNGEEDINNPIQKRDSFLEIIPYFRAIENNLGTCRDEFDRFYLSYNKFLNDNYNIPLKIDVKSPDILNVKENQNSNVPVIVDETTKEILKDDFFLVSGGAGDVQYETVDTDEDNILENASNRLVKSYFKPVLHQLRAKIDPINEQMKLKEKEVLAAKGIIVDEELLDDLKNERSTDDDEEIAIHDLVNKKRKPQSKYSENRDFLISKSQNPMHVRLIPLPGRPMISENIVGDENED